MITFILFLVPALDLTAWCSWWKLGALHLCLTLRRCHRRPPQLGTPRHGPLPRLLSNPQAPESRSSPLPAVPPAFTSTLLDHHAPTKQAAPIEHVLFDPRLLGIKLKVKFTGGAHKNKETDIASSIVGGQPVLPFMFYKTRINYPPKWVSIVPPNPTQDEGLLVIIKGEHCGKLVHRVHFRYGSDNIPIADLTVVHHSGGAKDSLTGEQLELMADDLGSVAKALSDKALNRDLMTALRTKHRKIHAK